MVSSVEIHFLWESKLNLLLNVLDSVFFHDYFEVKRTKSPESFQEGSPTRFLNVYMRVTEFS